MHVLSSSGRRTICILLLTLAVLCFDNIGLISQLGECISDGYDVKVVICFCFGKVLEVPAIANHSSTLHPSFCQQCNVLDLYHIGNERGNTDKSSWLLSLPASIFGINLDFFFVSDIRFDWIVEALRFTCQGAEI